MNLISVDIVRSLPSEAGLHHSGTGFCLSLRGQQMEEMRKLAELHSGLEDLAKWLRINRVDLLTERIPMEEAGFSSIAQAISCFYESYDAEEPNEGMLQKVYDYRTRHSLRFGLRGTDINDIYLGLFGRCHEISLFCERERWRYEVDLSRFLDQAERI